MQENEDAVWCPVFSPGGMGGIQEKGGEVVGDLGRDG